MPAPRQRPDAAVAPVVRTAEREPLIAADGSSVRELAHPDWSSARGLSLAEATVAPGEATRLHRHRRSEEIYLFSAGRGRMTLAGEEFAVAAGDCVVIAPGTPHRLVNDGSEPLVLLCCCAPAYSEEDTELREGVM